MDILKFSVAPNPQHLSISSRVFDPSLWRGGDNYPDANADARMHPLTLRFDGGLETEFANEYFARTLLQLRLAVALGFLLYTIFGLLDTWMAPNERHQLWFIRYAVVGPLLLGLLLFSYDSRFRRYRDPAVSFVVLVAALGILVMTAIIPPPGSYLYYAGLLLTLVFGFTLVRLSLPYATGVSALTVAAYLAVELGVNDTPTRFIVNNVFFLGSTLIIGFLSNYSMERYARSNFLQRRLIALRTEELEKKNDELVTKNQMLAESRAATIRTARRSELIFSALSEALPGTVLDEKYRVQEKIGSGGFGTVYRGEHILLHHPVAIKIFRPALGHDGLESLDRFRVEGISACRINHPNAVTVLDFDVSAGSLAYLVMELLHGHSLAEELRAEGRIPPERAIQIGATVCDALAEAHAAGIVHRDIKPSNVFLHECRGEQLVKVIDFGIAKLTDRTQTPEIQSETISGTFLGTPAYMAPERLFDQPYDGRADVFAVAVMIYEMISGRLPFDGAEPGHLALLRRHLLQHPPLLTEIATDVPPGLEVSLAAAMAKDASNRPTAAEFAAELRSFAVVAQ